MQPVPETREVRRTVRVAVALVVGQVLLCAVIGWVTFSYSLQHAHRGSTAVEQIAAPQPPIGWSSSPSAPGVTPAPAPRPSATTPREHQPRTADPAPPAESPAIEPPTVRLTRPLRPTIATPGTGSQSPQNVLVPPAAPATSAAPVSPTEAPVVAGAPCDRRDALGRTADGRDVRCLPDGQYRLRWKIV